MATRRATLWAEHTDVAGCISRTRIGPFPFECDAPMHVPAPIADRLVIEYEYTVRVEVTPEFLRDAHAAADTLRRLAEEEIRSFVTPT